MASVSGFGPYDRYMGKGDGAHQLVNDHVNDKDQTFKFGNSNLKQGRIPFGFRVVILGRSSTSVNSSLMGRTEFMTSTAFTEKTYCL